MPGNWVAESPATRSRPGVEPLDVRGGEEPRRSEPRRAGDRASDPPNFKECVAQVRKQVPTLAKTTDTQRKADCEQLFASLCSQVMDFLIKATGTRPRPPSWAQGHRGAGPPGARRRQPAARDGPRSCAASSPLSGQTVEPTSTGARWSSSRPTRSSSRCRERGPPGRSPRPRSPRTTTRTKGAVRDAREARSADRARQEAGDGAAAKARARRAARARHGRQEVLGRPQHARTGGGMLRA